MRYSLLLCLLLTSCAWGHRINYQVATDIPDPQFRAKTIAVASKDSRPYVVSGTKASTFVGLMRSLYGIPYNVHTTSGNPFADDINSAVAQSLRDKGYIVTQVTLAPGGDASVASTSIPPDFERLLLFQFNEWKTDVYFGMGLHYNVKLLVLPRTGAPLAEASREGHASLSGDYTLQQAIASILGELLAEPAVVAALDDPTAPVMRAGGSGGETKTQAAALGVTKGASRKCTIDQILTMRKAGLSDPQVKSACAELE